MRQNGTELIFGERRVAVARYLNYKVAFDRFGVRKGMIVNLKDPVEWIGIEGPENVTAAIQEIDSVLDLDESEWRDGSR